MDKDSSPANIEVDFGNRQVDEDLKRKVAARVGILSKVFSLNKATGLGSDAAKFDNSMTLRRCHEKLTAIARFEDGRFISDVTEFRDLRDTLCSLFVLMGLDTPTTMLIDSEMFQGKSNR